MRYKYIYKHTTESLFLYIIFFEKVQNKVSNHLRKEKIKTIIRTYFIQSNNKAIKIKLNL